MTIWRSQPWDILGPRCSHQNCWQLWILEHVNPPQDPSCKCSFGGREVMDTRPGKHTKKYGKSPLLVGKSTVNDNVQ